MREIAITPVDVLDVGAAWHVNIIDSGDVEMALARPREAFKRALARCSKD